MAKPKTQLRDLLYVGITFVLIYLLFSSLLESPEPQIITSSQGSEVVLYADRSGHFRGEGAINGLPVKYLVDTGASYLSIPESMAAQLGLAQQRKQRVVLETAAGKVQAYKVIISRVRFVGIEQRNVAAVVVPRLEQPLLGMNFLKRLSITQREGEMRLRVE